MTPEATVGGNSPAFTALRIKSVQLKAAAPRITGLGKLGGCGVALEQLSLGIQYL